MAASFRVLALIAAHNEEDIIDACIDHLTAQGVDSYLLNDGSTDRTVERASRHLGRGLIGVEDLPALDPPTFSLERILLRKQALARDLASDWFINQDADEFRESPWSELDLRGAIELVDGLGWNAIDFHIFTMRPVGASAVARVSPSDAESWYSPSAPYDKVQVRCWKRTDAEIDIIESAGHDTLFDGRRVFPVRFPMRHYPIRSQEQGERKIFTERLPRFDAGEQARQWHVQYAGLNPGAALTVNAAEVRRYDPTRARVEAALDNRDLEEARLHADEAVRQREAAEERAASLEQQVAGLEQQAGDLLRLLDESRLQRESDQASAAAVQSDLRGQIDRLTASVRTMEAHEASLQEQLHALGAANERIEFARTQLDDEYRRVLGEVQALYDSKTWRWTAPVRKVLGWLGVR